MPSRAVQLEAQPPGPALNGNRRTLEGILTILLFILAIGGWKAYVVFKGVPEYLLPPPERVLDSLVELIVSGEVFKHLFVTLSEVIVGFVIGSIGGILAGYLLGRWRLVEEIFSPYILFAQTAPKIALIPLFVIWFGLGLTSKVVLIVSMTFFPVMVNTILGLRSIDTNVRNLLRILKATAWQRFISVELFASLPLIFAGLRLGMVQAVIGAIVAEWVSGKTGLGYLLVLGNMTYNSGLLIAAILLTTLLGIVTYMAVMAVENRVLYWHESKAKIGGQDV
ncbi:MAG TPA: ABC transporter permease [Firmicutes bacterium]|nr:ABC transporter permease [Bacillota bacterium]